MATLSSGLGAWWRQPDHFDWFMAYLRARRMAATTRGVLVATTLVMAVVSPAMLFGTAPPTGTTDAVLAVLAGIGGVTAAAAWIVRFPTRTQSVAYSLLCTASIAMGVLAQSDPMTAILGCTAFATISGYIALFHTAPLMVLNLLVILGVSAVPAMALAHDGGLIRALTAYALMLAVNVAVPYGVQIIVHTLGVDLLRADRDPLTGLYHRDAFYKRTAALIGEARRDAHLVIAMIDLDRFKQLNDTQGHAVGDLALAAVGLALREHTRHGAVIGRAGGEEFVVADVFSDRGDEELFGRRLCDAIAGLPHRITASVGTDGIRCDHVIDGDRHAEIAALIRSADAAMYDAKRRGGNQVRQGDSTGRSPGRR